MIPATLEVVVRQSKKKMPFPALAGKGIFFIMSSD